MWFEDELPLSWNEIIILLSGVGDGFVVHRNSGWDFQGSSITFNKHFDCSNIFQTHVICWIESTKNSV